MSSINKYIDVFKKFMFHHPPTTRIIENSVKHLCESGKESGKESGTEELKEEVEKRLKGITEKPHIYNRDWLDKEIERAKKYLDEIASVIDCPLEYVPLYVNSGRIASEIAKRRLKDAE